MPPLAECISAHVLSCYPRNDETLELMVCYQKSRNGRWLPTQKTQSGDTPSYLPYHTTSPVADRVSHDEGILVYDQKSAYSNREDGRTGYSRSVSTDSLWVRSLDPLLEEGGTGQPRQTIHVPPSIRPQGLTHRGSGW